jgi:hypothetical protein
MNKTECIDRARSLIATGDEVSLRYAALELRMCMELITYEKLRTYSSMIPESVLKKWQPPQAVKALLEFEPDADKSYILSFGRQPGLGLPAESMTVLGEHKSLSRGWLRTHYNKMGSILHAQAKASVLADGTKRKAYLEQVVSELEEVISSRINGSGMRTVFSSECERCDGRVVVNSAAAKNTGRAVCFNPECKAGYTITTADDWSTCEFLLVQSEFACIECDTPIYLPTHELAIGRSFRCGNCKAMHKLNSEWVYGIEGEATGDAKDI